MKPVILSPLTLVFLAALLGVTIAGYVLIPAAAMLPIHWGLDGQPDQFWPRDFALLIAPAAVIVLIGTAMAAQRFASSVQMEAGRHLWQAMIPAITGLFLSIQTVIVLLGLGLDVPVVRIIALGVAVQLIVIGNVLPKSRPNGLAGIRLPWTLADNANWTSTHRLTGFLLVIGGLALALAALVMASAPALLAVLLATTLLPIAVGALFSYARSRR